MICQVGRTEEDLVLGCFVVCVKRAKVRPNALCSFAKRACKLALGCMRGCKRTLSTDGTCTRAEQSLAVWSELWNRSKVECFRFHLSHSLLVFGNKNYDLYSLSEQNGRTVPTPYRRGTNPCFVRRHFSAYKTVASSPLK